MYSSEKIEYGRMRLHLRPNGARSFTPFRDVALVFVAGQSLHSSSGASEIVTELSSLGL